MRPLEGRIVLAPAPDVVEEAIAVQELDGTAYRNHDHSLYTKVTDARLAGAVGALASSTARSKDPLLRLVPSGATRCPVTQHRKRKAPEKACKPGPVT